jgi:hypothetical protein
MMKSSLESNVSKKFLDSIQELVSILKTYSKCWSLIDIDLSKVMVSIGCVSKPREL